MDVLAGGCATYTARNLMTINYRLKIAQVLQVRNVFFKGLFIDSLI